MLLIIWLYCKFVNSENISLGKNPKTVNSLKTSVIVNLLTLQKKANERFNCPGIVMSLFPKGHKQKRRFLPLTKAWEMQTGALSLFKRETQH